MDWQSIMNSVELSFQEGAYKGVVRRCDSALLVAENDEQRAETHYQRGHAYLQLNNNDSAIADWKKAADYGHNHAVKMLKENYNITYTPQKPSATSGTTAPPPAAKPMPASVTPAAPAPVQVYKIGDKGPAGGIVFYDKGNNSDGWRYMEVSPVDLGRTAKWFTEKLFNPKVSGAKKDIGAGKRNTELILALCEKKNETDTAAQRCSDYTLNDYKDWFLPSFDELYELRNLSTKPEINGFVNKTYWSSTQTSSGSAWDRAVSRSGVIDSSGGHYGTEKMNFVRAVRYF
jgi:tetratricopeptide (TPR) repeat protein